MISQKQNILVNGISKFLSYHIVSVAVRSSFSLCTGTIGLLGKKSPPFFTLGRMMKSLVENLQDTPFYVNQRLRKVFVDFGNSLPVYENGSFATSGFEGLLVALPVNENPTMSCSDELLWLGTVYDTYPNWYRNSAGVQIFPALGSLTANDMEKLNSRPLVVAEVHGSVQALIDIAF